MADVNHCIMTFEQQVPAQQHLRMSLPVVPECFFTGSDWVSATACDTCDADPFSAAEETTASSTFRKLLKSLGR